MYPQKVLGKGLGRNRIDGSLTRYNSHNYEPASSCVYKYAGVLSLSPFLTLKGREKERCNVNE